MVWHAILACREVCFAPDIRRNLHEKWGLVIGFTYSEQSMKIRNTTTNAKTVRKCFSRTAVSLCMLKAFILESNTNVKCVTGYFLLYQHYYVIKKLLILNGDINVTNVTKNSKQEKVFEFTTCLSMMELDLHAIYVINIFYQNLD